MLFAAAAPCIVASNVRPGPEESPQIGESPLVRVHLLELINAMISYTVKVAAYAYLCPASACAHE